jgi:hypothetical protein
MKQEAQIAKRENAGPLATNVFEADAGQGVANIKQEDLALPFLKVLGQLSPEVNKKDAKHVEGAEPGMIINTVTNELYDGEKGIQVLPVYYKRQHIEWNSMMMGIKMQGKNGLFTPPTYSHIYKLKTVQQSNDKGTWFGWDVSKVGPITDKGIYEIAKGFSTNVAKGAVITKHGDSESKSEAPF